MRRPFKLDLAGLRWPARFEILRDAPLVIADGAHTPYAMARLRDSLRAYFSGQPRHFVLGMLRDKDAASILKIIAEDAARITCTAPPLDRALPADQLLAIWQTRFGDGHGPPVMQISDPEIALQRALDEARPGDIICVTGSIHLAAQASRWLRARE
jgi:dihydrofolate synthase/folylpolyglutamate synthase